MQEIQNQNEKQVLTFVLNEEIYGVDILRIQEIKDIESCTPIPNTPDWVLGVLNLRGSVVPIFDLRKMFFNEYKKEGVIIVLRVEFEEKQKIVGVVVDSVSNTEFANMNLLQDSPKNTKEELNNYVEGLVSIENRMVILMNVDKIDFFKG